MQTRNFYYNNYTVSRTGIVTRVGKNQGAVIGRRLRPYYPSIGGSPYVKLCAGSKQLQINIRDLIDRVWK